MWSAGRRGGSIDVYQRLIIYHFTITDERVCQNRRTSSFTDYGGINPKQIGRLHTILLDANKCHQSPGGPVRKVCDDAAVWPCGRCLVSTCSRRHSLTLSGVLEVERLETPGERRGVNNVHAVLAVIFPVQHDSHHKDCNGDYAGSKA